VVAATTAPGGRIAAPESAPIGRRRPSWPAVGHRLAAQVEEWLAQWWSPEAISRRLRMGLPDDPLMWVAHETIYQALFVQGPGELRRELTRCLRRRPLVAAPHRLRRARRATTSATLAHTRALGDTPHATTSSRDLAVASCGDRLHPRQVAVAGRTRPHVGMQFHPAFIPRPLVNAAVRRNSHTGDDQPF
jgi:hypothetical protein